MANVCPDNIITMRFHNNIINVLKCPALPVFLPSEGLNELQQAVCPQLGNFNSHYNDKKSFRDKQTEADVLVPSPCTANELWHTVCNKKYVHPLAFKEELAKFEVTAIKIKSYRAFILYCVG